ncbi:MULTISPECIES: DoxX family protein [unclassified Streptomyces]|uniref:DoxX family protein n=1 Tax=Streptomyces sp. NPDC005955 TaxID=3364738 RepID=UPI0036D14251
MTVGNTSESRVSASGQRVLTRRTTGAHVRPRAQRRPLSSAADNMAVRITVRGPLLLRISVGVVFLWFGALKLFPNTSPAEGVAVRATTKLTFGLLPQDFIVPLLALLETAIGIGLVTGLLLRLTLVVFFGHMAGVFSALFLLHDEMWRDGLPIPTMEGQYILKNVVLVAACLIVAADEWNRRTAYRVRMAHGLTDR